MTLVIEQLFLGGDGPTVMVKDTIDLAGLPTRASSQALEDAAPATVHADVVQALLEKGCRLVGKTSLHELAFGTTGINHWTGTAPNPRFPGRIPGGSSSGSAAAVAAGLADFFPGNRHRRLCAHPGVLLWGVRLKPTFGGSAAVA